MIKGKQKWYASIAYGEDYQESFSIEYDIAIHLNKGDQISFHKNGEEVGVDVLSKFADLERKYLILFCAPEGSITDDLIKKHG